MEWFVGAVIVSVLVIIGFMVYDGRERDN